MSLQLKLSYFELDGKLNIGGVAPNSIKSDKLRFTMEILLARSQRNNDLHSFLHLLGRVLLMLRRLVSSAGDTHDYT